MSDLDTTLHLSDWAAAMARDVRAATASASLSAISIQPPRSKTPGQWPDLWAALVAAAARGVRVTLYLPPPSNTHPATRFNSNTATVAAAAGIATRFLRGPRLLHCKSLVLDARVVWIGSGNFTSAAAHHNVEAYLRTERPDFAATIAARWDALT